jgi:hypothetical protein
MIPRRYCRLGEPLAQPPNQSTMMKAMKCELLETTDDGQELAVTFTLEGGKVTARVEPGREEIFSNLENLAPQIDPRSEESPQVPQPPSRGTRPLSTPASRPLRWRRVMSLDAALRCFSAISKKALEIVFNSTITIV